jgi:hypothetical protein
MKRYGYLSGLLLLLGGCGDYAPFVVAPQEEPEPPRILRVLVTPTEFDLLGGTVTIEAEVGDPNNDVAQVVAEVTPPEGAPETVTLSARQPGVVYRGTYQTAGNPSEEEADDVYGVKVVATDRRGLEAELAGENVTVSAAPRPPDPADLEGDE